MAPPSCRALPLLLLAAWVLGARSHEHHGDEHAHHDDDGHGHSHSGKGHNAPHACIHDAIEETTGEKPVAPQNYGLTDIEWKEQRMLASINYGTGGAFSQIRIAFDFSALDNAGEQANHMCVPGDSSSGKTIILSDGSDMAYVCQRTDELDSAKRNFLVNTLAADAKAWWENTLSTVAVQGLLKLGNAPNWGNYYYMCVDGQMPPKFYNTGQAGADYIMFVTARPTTGTTLAWALACQRDQHGRPIAGHINFGPAHISTATRDRSRQLNTALHEVAHALGFSSSDYAYYRNPETGAARGINSVTKQYTQNGKAVTKLITPALVAKVKEHYGCDNLANAGLELEDYGGSGSAGSHFEKRLVNNEFMSSTISTNGVKSALTLALFTDMGWYSVNFASAEYLAWGYRQGCPFVEEVCANGWDSRHFCETAGARGCTVDRLEKAYCNLQDYGTTVPSHHQYFASSTMGGASRVMDYCPYFTGYSNTDCRNLGVSATTPDSRLSEVIGSDSKCFMSKATGYSTYYPACFSTACTGGVLTVTTTKGSNPCPAQGGTITIVGDTISCPPVEEVCTSSVYCNDGNGCNDNGLCSADGSCSCFSGFTGDGCDQKQCPFAKPIYENFGSVPPDAAASDAEPLECSGISDIDGPGRQATSCDRSGGASAVCVCAAGFDGPACEQELCPAPDTAGQESSVGQQCAGHGNCTKPTDGNGDPIPQASPICVCEDGFKGSDCSNAEGCSVTAGEVGYCGDGSGSHGTCDQYTGACACAANGVDEVWTGATCDSSTAVTVGRDGDVPAPFLTALDLSTGSDGMSWTAGTVASKAYAYFFVDLQGSVYDITVVMRSKAGGDADMYAQYEDEQDWYGYKQGDSCTAADRCLCCLANQTVPTSNGTCYSVKEQWCKADTGGTGEVTAKLAGAEPCTLNIECLSGSCGGTCEQNIDTPVRAPPSSLEFVFSSSVETGEGSRDNAELGYAFYANYTNAATGESFVPDDVMHLCGSNTKLPRYLAENGLDTARTCRASDAEFNRGRARLTIAVQGFEYGVDTEFEIAVFQDECAALDCGIHAEQGCKSGACVCDEFWTGELCDILDCPGTPDCSNKGVCVFDGLVRNATTRPPTFFALPVGRLLEGEEEAEDAGGNVGRRRRRVDGIPTWAARGGRALEAAEEQLPEGGRIGRQCGGCIESDAMEGEYCEAPSVPYCCCSLGFLGESCGELDDSLEAAPVPLGSNGTVGDPFFSDGVETNSVNAGKWRYYKITLPPAATTGGVGLSVSLRQRDASECATFLGVPNPDECGRGDPVLALARNQFPTLSEYTAFDIVDWTQDLDTQRLFVDAASGSLRSGEWYIGIYNTRYARSPLHYDLVVDATTRCPADYALTVNATTRVATKVAHAVCSGRGSCVTTPPAGGLLTAACDCGEGAQGLTCETSIDVINMTAPEEAISSPAAQSLNPAEWAYSSVLVSQADVSARRRLRVTLRAIPGPDSESDIYVASASEEPLLLLRSSAMGAGVPTLSNKAIFNYDDWSAQRREQVVEMKAETLGAGTTVFVGVHHRSYASQPLNFLLDVSMIDAAAAVGGAVDCEPSSGGVSGACSGRGICTSSAGVFSCTCNEAWQGDFCQTPVLRAISNMQQAAQSIESLSNVDVDTKFIQREGFLLFRIPQPLQTNAALRIAVSAGNESSGDPDVFISEQLPRSAYDFTLVFSNTGLVEELLLTNQSSSGRFWMAVYARGDAVYTITTQRIDGPKVDTLTDSSFVEELGEWLTTETVGIITLSIFVVLVAALFGLCLHTIFDQNPHIKIKARRTMNKMKSVARMDSFARGGASGMQRRPPPGSSFAASSQGGGGGGSGGGGLSQHQRARQASSSSREVQLVEGGTRPPPPPSAPPTAREYR